MAKHSISKLISDCGPAIGLFFRNITFRITSPRRTLSRYLYEFRTYLSIDFKFIISRVDNVSLSVPLYFRSVFNARFNGARVVGFWYVPDKSHHTGRNIQRRHLRAEAKSFDTINVFHISLAVKLSLRSLITKYAFEYL